ncbi:MAG: UTP--glucose-1-phosphate uridylyltransferase [Wenzhouxiangella sp.]
MTPQELDPILATIRERMRHEQLPPLAIAAFERQVRQLARGQTGLIADSELAPLTDVPRLDDLADDPATAAQALKQCVVIKLNGGLGTSMGLNQAKSLLPARADQSFLALIAQQVLHARQQHQVALPLVLMNSFSTEQDSLAQLANYPDLAAGQNGIPLSFRQHKVPRLAVDTLAPVQWPQDRAREWCPPGHGDLYTALVTTGLLDKLLERGLRYAFVSNADNLGASLEPRILALMHREQAAFLMEVTDRTLADRKGGHLARDRDGRLILRESAQCPPDDQGAFQDIHRHRFFNTNNLWLNLEQLKQRLDNNHGLLDLPLIRNRKHVVPEEPTTPAVYQLETAMGAAIECFDNAQVVAVPRQRFAPVKTTADLLVLWSDRYRVDHSGRVLPTTDTPIRVELDPHHYGPIDAFRQRFPHGAPSLINATALSLHGDIRFEANVTLRGEVHLRNDGKAPRVIEAGSVLEAIDERQ